MHYTLKYSDNLIYRSPDIRSKDPGWMSESRKQSIVEMDIRIPGGRVIVLRNFEQYNFFVEACACFGRSRGVQLEAFNFCGSYQGKVLLWKINLAKQTITKTVHAKGREYYGTATRGWHKGISGQKAVSYVCNN
jgi:hypothetical protein